jgi:hypothetical protein
MLAGTLVDEVMAPRVFWNTLFKIWSSPVLRVPRSLYEFEQTVSSLGKVTVIHLVGAKGGAEYLKLEFSGSNAGPWPCFAILG